jgi:hypothetical protein
MMTDPRMPRIAFVVTLFLVAGCAATNVATSTNSSQNANRQGVVPMHPAIGRAIPVPLSLNGDSVPGSGGVVITGGSPTPFPTGSTPPSSPPGDFCQGYWWYSPGGQWECLPLFQGSGLGVGYGQDGSWYYGCQGCQATDAVDNVNVQKKILGPTTSTLTSVGGVPLGIVADASGNAYVTAFPHNFIDYYAAGSTTPTSTITDAHLSTIYFLAMDKSRNLFYDGWGTGGPGTGLQIDEYNNTSHATTKLLTIPGKFPGGMAIDPLGILYVADEGNGTSGVIESLKPPYRRVSRSFSYSGLITGIDLDKTGKVLWVSNLNAGGVDAAQAYNSHTGALRFTSTALPAGIYSYGIAVKKLP